MQLNTKYFPKEVEEKIYKFWIENDYFSSKVSDRLPFCIVIPPPNITGILHMGHALNNTIQDVLVRFKRMRQYESLWMPGTDHAGIATQNVVERQLAKEKLTKEAVGREEFLKLLWDWKTEYGSTIIEQLKKLGASCDWKRTRFTMDEEYSLAVKEVFVKLFNKGLIYRGEYIINWCPRCKTALSDEEAPHREIEGWLYYIRYPVKSASLKKGVPPYVVVATTRPETMLGDTAVAIHPHDQRYRSLKDAVVTLPIVERELKVIEDELIDPEFGTGIVKVTPAHDPVDFTLGKKHKLSFLNIMYEDATLNDNATEEFAGMDRFEARQAILDVLKKKKLIERKEPYKINAGHCYRCHTLIEPRLSLQWFVRMKPLAEPAIRVVETDQIRFYPERWKKVYLNWMYNIEDWCISRQIWWGHRLPVYYCKKCQAASNEPSEDIRGVIVSGTKPDMCPECGSPELVQDQDVLDTWFSSWLWPFATFYWPQKNQELDYFYPTSVLVTASEILFFWVARMIMAALEFTGSIPFRDVVIHGTVRDRQGIKMSKSLGNIIDPLDIIEKFGADSLRFSLMMLASAGSDVYLSDEKFLVGRNFANKIWNATRLILLKIDEEHLNVEDLDCDSGGAPETWIIDHLNETISKTAHYLDAYRINEATKQIYDFFWHHFCDWYVEIAKDNFTVHTAKVLLHCLIASLKMLAPIMPFITEEIFQLLKSTVNFPKEESIMISPWPREISLAGDKRDIYLVNTVIEMIKEIRNIKLDLGVPATKRISLRVKSSGELRDFLTFHKAWIVRLAGLKDFEFVDGLRRALYKTEDIEVDFCLEKIDRDKFLVSLEKKIEDLGSQCDRISQKLNNEGFLKKAPPETVMRERERFNSLSTQKERLSQLKEVVR